MTVSSKIHQFYPLSDEAKKMYRSGGLALVLISDNEVVKISYVTDLVETDEQRDIPAIFKDKRFLLEVKRLASAGHVHFGLFKFGCFMSFDHIFKMQNELVKPQTLLHN